jgi:hypothetical protein
MPEAQPETLTANQRFDALWDEVGAKRIVIGEEADGVVIRVDADLSVFGVLDKLKAAARGGHGKRAAPEAGKSGKDEDGADLKRALRGLYDDLTKEFGRKP